MSAELSSGSGGGKGGVKLVSPDVPRVKAKHTTLKACARPPNPEKTVDDNAKKMSALYVEYQMDEVLSIKLRSPCNGHDVDEPPDWTRLYLFKKDITVEQLLEQKPFLAKVRQSIEVSKAHHNAHSGVATSLLPQPVVRVANTLQPNDKQLSQVLEEAATAKVIPRFPFVPHHPHLRWRILTALCFRTAVPACSCAATVDRPQRRCIGVKILTQPSSTRKL
jgi:hypothetical protein